jgi:hypothetical protein
MEKSILLLFQEREIILLLEVLTAVYLFGKAVFAKKMERFYNKKGFVNQDIEPIRGRCPKLNNA